MISHGLWVVGYYDRFDSLHVYAAEYDFTALSLPLSYLFLSLLGPHVLYKLLRSILPVLHAVLRCVLGGDSV